MDLKTKKILVTGSDGFIGSHLTERLVDMGLKVKAFVYYNSFNSYGWLDTFPKDKLAKIEVFTGDVRDPNGVRTAVKDCDVVFHLAALIGIPFSYHSPDCYVDTNIKGTLNVLNACRDHGVKKCIITSTSETYGTAKYVPIDEDHPLQGQSPYSATKIAADQLSLSFYRSFNTPVAIIRPFNAYGPRQSARAIIPTIISQIAAKKNEIHVGSLQPTRDFTFVLDLVDAFVAMAENDKTIGDVINIGSSFEISIGDLVKKIKAIMNSNAKVVSEEDRKRPEKSEVERLWASNAKAKQVLGWSPKHTLDEGLKKTVDWFMDKKNLAGYKTDIYNV
nr:NAD-dependent 4,6-dehydratase LegB [Candidatus Sigynarchaeota archaeon]